MTTTAIAVHGPRKSHSGKIVLDARCIRLPAGSVACRERARLTNAIGRVAGNEQ